MCNFGICEDPKVRRTVGKVAASSCLVKDPGAAPAAASAPLGG